MNTGTHGNAFRVAGWSIGALILFAPLVAMQFTTEVNWGTDDFVFAGILVFGTGMTFELAARKSVDGAYRLGVGIALAAVFLLMWLAAGVGIIGKDGDPANGMYLVVLAVGISGAFIARARAEGLARTLISMAVVQALIALIAIAGGLGRPWSGPLEIALLNGFFVAAFLVSAAFFAKAARADTQVAR